MCVCVRTFCFIASVVVGRTHGPLPSKRQKTSTSRSDSPRARSNKAGRKKETHAYPLGEPLLCWWMLRPVTNVFVIVSSRYVQQQSSVVSRNTVISSISSSSSRLSATIVVRTADVLFPSSPCDGAAAAAVA